MGRLNNYIKGAILHSTTWFTVVGVSFIALAIFVLVSDWGSLDKDFFLGWGILIVFFGFFLMLTSCVGYQGVRFQRKKIGFWKGRRIIALFQVILIGTLIAELWIVIKMASAVTSLESSRESVRESEGEPLAYDNLEKNIAVRFNTFFFGAVDGCYDAKYQWFWDWLNDHCIEGIGADRCRKCGDFSVSTCEADRNSCYSSEDEAGPTCPYELCRENTLTFIIRSVKPVYLYTLVFSAFHVLLIVLTCALMCYTERDTLEQMLTKTGTITQSASNAHDNITSVTPAPRSAAEREAASILNSTEARTPVLQRQDVRVAKDKKKDKGGRAIAQRNQNAEVELV